MTVRLCFIGYGAIAKFHASILKASGAMLHTVVGRAPEDTARFATEFGFRYHTTDLSAALSQADVDAIVIASPSHLHYDHARRALLAGKHTLVEVPLAIGYKQGLELVELAQQHNLSLMVAQSHRFFPSLASVQKRVAGGLLHVRHLIGRSVFLRREHVGWTGRQRNWADSLLWHHGSHLVDFSLWLLGANQAAVVAQVARPDPETGEPMDLDILLRTPADQLVSLSLSFNCDIHQNEEYLIIGEEESFRFEEGKLFVSDGVRDDPAALGQDYYRLAWEAQDREFLASLNEGRQPTVSGADVLAALAILQEIEDRFGIAG